MRPVPGLSVSQWVRTLGIESAELHGLAAYWEALRGDRPLPRRSDIEPEAIRALLPHIWLWSYDRESRGFFLRLAGEEIRRVVGPCRRGTPMARVIPPPAYPEAYQRCLRVAETPAAACFTGESVLGNGLRLPAERLILPLGDGGDSTTDIIGVTAYHWRAIPADAGDFTDEEVGGDFLALVAEDGAAASSA